MAGIRLKYEGIDLDIEVDYFPAYRGKRDSMGVPEEPDEEAYLEIVGIKCDEDIMDLLDADLITKLEKEIVWEGGVCEKLAAEILKSGCRTPRLDAHEVACPTEFLVLFFKLPTSMFRRVNWIVRSLPVFEIASSLKIAIIKESDNNTVCLFVFSEDGGAYVDLEPPEIMALIEQLNQSIQ